MWVWTIIGVVVLAAAVWAFWPRRGGIDGERMRRSRHIDEGRAEQYRPPNPNQRGGGTFWGGNP